MDPYETQNPRQYKPSFLQKRLDCFPLGPAFVNYWEPDEVDFENFDLPVPIRRTVNEIKRENRSRRYVLGRHTQRKLWRKSLD